MIAAVIKSRNAEELQNDLKNIDGAELIELRLDYIKGFDYNLIKKIKKSLKRKVLATCRKHGEGGVFHGNEKEKAEILKNAVEYGADYADIEYSSGKDLIKNLIKNKKNAKIVVSYHNFLETPANIKEIYNKIKMLNPDLIKIVAHADSVTDNFRIFELIKNADKEKRKIVAFCMGPCGRFSRILSLILGSQITYASVGDGMESASGQPTIDELVNHYRIKKINRGTKIAGLIGNPVEHSWSHIMHNAGFDELKANAVYLKFRVDRLKEFIEYFKKLNALGFSVTIPHKIRIMEYLDGIDKKAEAIGAVNTVAVKNKKFIGYNTDCDGAMTALKEKTKLKGKNVVMLGAGGSARALAYGLKVENANATILNRTMESAKSIAEDFGFGYGSLNDLKDIDYDILINTTSVGMHPETDDSIIPPNLIKKKGIVFDIVFNPFKTKLLKDAEKRGCIIIPGFEMLARGAALQFKLWTGKNAPERLMRKKVMDYLKNAGNKN